MKIMNIDAEHVGISCGQEFLEIICSINGYLSLHDEEFQNQFMSHEKPQEFKFENGAKLFIGRKNTVTCYFTYYMGGEPLFTETFGFNKDRGYARGSQNIEISLSRTLKYGKSGVFIRARKEKAALIRGQIEYLYKTFIRTLYHDYLKTVEKPVKFKKPPTLVTELGLNKCIEEKIGYTADKTPKKIKDVLRDFEYELLEPMSMTEFIYRAHDAGIKIDEPDYDSLDTRDCYHYTDEEEARAGRSINHTFDYNKDIKTRDELIFGAYEPRNYGKGGTHRFDGITADTLRKLLNMKFADPDGIQNRAPSINAFMNFISTHEGYTVGGYTVSDKREDYRVSIDSIKHDKKLDEDGQIVFAGFADCVKRWYRDAQNETWKSPTSKDEERGYAWWD